MIGRRREKLTLDALDDLMSHLAGLRDERKAVLLVTEGWLLYQPNPNLADQVAKRMGPAPPAAFEPPVKPPSERGPFTEFPWQGVRSRFPHSGRRRQRSAFSSDYG